MRQTLLQNQLGALAGHADDFDPFRLSLREAKKTLPHSAMKGLASGLHAIGLASILGSA
jgi:hypothetical protein